MIKIDYRKGDRVDYSCDGEFWRGAVTKVVKEKVFVELDGKYGGEIKTITGHNLMDLSYSDTESEEQANELEEAFTKLVQEKTPEIKKKFNQADALIKEAIAMCEKDGIPVETKIIGKYGYIPRSYRSKFSSMDSETVESLTGLSINFEGGTMSGWVSSSSYC